MLNQSGIYEILNTVNGKRYIGQASNFKKRWIRHQNELKNGKHHSHHLQHAWNKYGATVFKFSVLLICKAEKAILTFYEQQCFDAFHPEYNIQPAAGSPLGMKHGPEFSAKISARNKGNKYAVGNTNALGYHHTPDACAKIGTAAKGNKWALGYKHTPDEIEQIRTSSTGRVRSPETAVKMLVINTGRVVSTETRAKISKGNTGKVHTPEHKEKNRVASTGRKHTQEAKEKNRVASTGKQPFLGHKHTQETIERLREINTGKTLSLEMKLRLSELAVSLNTPERAEKQKAGVRAWWARRKNAERLAAEEALNGH